MIGQKKQCVFLFGISSCFSSLFRLLCRRRPSFRPSKRQTEGTEYRNIPFADRQHQFPMPTTTAANFINGAFAAPIGGTYVDSFNPSTGAVHLLVPDSDERDVEAAVASALVAFKTYVYSLLRQLTCTKHQVVQDAQGRPRGRAAPHRRRHREAPGGVCRGGIGGPGQARQARARV